MDRLYSPKLAQQFLGKPSIESGFEEGIELYSQHWDFLHVSLGSLRRCQQAWGRFCPLADVLSFPPLFPHAPSTRGGLSWHRRIQSCGILLPLVQELSKIKLGLSLRSLLGCALKTRNKVPALQGAPAWKRLPETKGLGKSTPEDKRDTCKVITLPRNAQSAGNGKKGSVS